MPSSSNSPKRDRFHCTADRRESLVECLSRRASLSRRKAKQLLDRKRVRVNGRPVWMARHSLRPGDRVEAALEILERAPDPEILYRDGHIVVVDKPPGLLSVGRNSCIEGLADRLKCRVFPVHRLDRDTSGCLVAALTSPAEEHLLAQFKQRETSKTYWTVAAGRPRESKGCIRTRLDGKEAETAYRVLHQASKTALLEVRIGTGRKHQIRRHLAGMHCPVLGDPQYGLKDQPRLHPAPRRMALHALELSFRHPTSGDPRTFRTPPPKDFGEVLSACGIPKKPAFACKKT